MPNKIATMLLIALALGSSAAMAAGGESDEGLVPLFNGKDLTGWNTKGNWVAEEGGVLALKPRPGERGWTRYDAYLWTERQYGDFVLDLEYKHGKGGNSGVFVRVKSLKNPVNTGIEVQILDSHGKRGKLGHHDCGGVIRTVGPSKNMAKPAGQWNRMIVACRKSRMTVELNGEQIIDVKLDESPMKNRPLVGYIGLQDHGQPLWFRNIRINDLGGAPGAPPGEGWEALFDGETLDGWTQRNGTATYRVEDGTIVGKTNEGSPNSFLCSDREYGDFELTFEVKVDNRLNSGVQIRSRTRGGKPKGRVQGPQVEIAVNGTAGFIYGEALGTGWLSPNRKDPAKNAAFKRGEWNRYRVRAVGKHIETWVNGTKIADLTDERSGMPEGFIGLQVHGIPRGKGPYEVRWRRLFIKDLGEK